MYESNPRSAEHYLYRSAIRPEKIQACTGFEPMTSAVPGIKKCYSSNSFEGMFTTERKIEGIYISLSKNCIK